MAHNSATAARMAQELAEGEVLLPKEPTRVEIRMYCMGTGDCFVLKFYAGPERIFTMMIDCGSCVGTPEEFRPYVENLATWIKHDVEPEGKNTSDPERWEGGVIDLLVVTHEHQDHVNGFAKCADIFQQLKIRQAWFAWTENPKDPGGVAQDMQRKRMRMREGFQKALNKIDENRQAIEKENTQALSALNSLFMGLETLGEINLDEKGSPPGKPLAGMTVIKELVRDNPDTVVRYLSPGTSLSFPQLPDVKFHVLGPPLDKKYIYKDGREGKDVYKRHFSIGEGILAMNTFANLGSDEAYADLPFGREYVVDEKALTDADIKEAAGNMQEYLKKVRTLLNTYNGVKGGSRKKADDEKWRQIENEWLYTAGSLAIRLNSHINNTSLALAIETGKNGKVLLLPGDAEYGSWESWHMIEKWDGAGPNGKHFVEDLLNRTVFYKVSHHLSYNGTPLDKGIKLMSNPGLTTMVTLDRMRISPRWKTTMPNSPLLSELIERCEGRCIIMNEDDIVNPPSDTVSPASLPDYAQHAPAETNPVLWKQYTVRL